MHHDHPWILPGPWYSWENRDVPLSDPPPVALNYAKGRISRPLIQKYCTSSFVSDFLSDPQQSLRFDGTDQHPELSGLQKIFLSTHNRFYLVVCELHCDAPGLPSVRRGDVCEAGFVVRRRTTTALSTVSPSDLVSIENSLKQISRIRYRLRKLMTRTLRERSGNVILRTIRKAAGKARADQLCEMSTRLADERTQLRELTESLDLTGTTQRWLPGKTAGFGHWSTVQPDIASALGSTFDSKSTASEQQGADSGADEVIYPLFPLIPDPSIEDHSAESRNLWFGVVPTGSGEVNETGMPQYDDQSIYENRCFVRRHETGKRKTNERGDCCGEIFWSMPTEPYRLASHFDLDGTSNQVTTIQLPDLTAIEAKVNESGFQMGNGVGMAMLTPNGTELSFTSHNDGSFSAGNKGGSGSICFFAIPLITIVAMFLLRLFLPVVVFVFQLWFMLLLKFCITPSLTIGAGLATELKLQGDFDIGAEVALDAQILSGLKILLGNTALPNDDNNDLRDYLIGLLDSADPEEQQRAVRMLLGMSADFRESLSTEIRELLGLTSEAGSIRGQLPDPQDKLNYYSRVRIAPRGQVETGKAA